MAPKGDLAETQELGLKSAFCVAFVAAFDAGNVPHVARVLRERHLSAAMVIAADN